jgi:hypothetical protein
LHFPEQQLPSDVQDAPDGLHAQAAAAWQLVSEQSVAPSQSLSTPSEHMPGADSLTGGGPQSLEQVQRSSLALHMPSPQKGGGPQSISQLKPLSLPPHTASPQQNAEADALLHREPPEVHRASLHETEFAPPPLPQQKRSDGFPFCLPRQSLGQETQFSPLAASQTPFPQVAPLPETQSLGQLVQISSVSQMPSLSQTGHAVQPE